MTTTETVCEIHQILDVAIDAYVTVIRAIAKVRYDLAPEHSAVLDMAIRESALMFEFTLS